MADLSNALTRNEGLTKNKSVFVILVLQAKIEWMVGGVVVLGDIFPVSESCLELVTRHVFE